MAKKEHISETQATQLLRKHQVSFDEHPYPYEEHGGTSVSARELGVPEHDVIKTLVMQDEAAKPLIVLMHGDCKVSTQEPGALHRLQIRRAVQARRGAAPFWLHDRRHVAVRYEEGHARVRGAIYPGIAAHLHQWRTARFPRLAGATGTRGFIESQAGAVRLAGLRKPVPALSVGGALVYILLRQPRCWCNKHNKGKK